MRQSSAKATQREIRRAFGSSAVALLDTHEKTLETLAAVTDTLRKDQAALVITRF